MASVNAKFSLSSLPKFPNQAQLKKLEKNHILSYSEVESDAALQSLKFHIFGLHPKKCQIALSKISRYENYQEYLGVVKKSTYENKVIYLELSHLLLPFDMSMKFKMERVSKPGHYKFSFNQGFLSGLQGDVIISKQDKRCLFVGRSYWKGKDSGISDTIFSFFTKQLTKITMETLFKISKTY